MPGTRYFIGLDLGQVKDSAALAVLAKPSLTIEQLEKDPAPPLDVVHLQRWPLGTSYPTVVDDVVSLFGTPLLTDATLAVDGTGVGVAVVNFLSDAIRERKVSCKFQPIVITAGSAVTRDEAGVLRVPKKQLVATLQKLLRGRRLRVAEALPEAATLVRELGSFEVRISDSANETFGEASGRHDDLLLATMLAAWIAR